MSKYWPTVAVVSGAALIVVAGGVLASNMGFLVHLSLSGPSPGVSLSGRHLIALPYRPQTNTLTAGDLLRYINNGDCIGHPAHAVQKHDRATDAFISYDGCSGTDFSLIPGEAFYLLMRQSATVQISGTHDPSVRVQFLGPGPGSASGTNYYAHPYHGVASTAKELFREIGGDVQLIYQLRIVDDSYEIYTFGGGTLPPDGWNLKRGEGYAVKVGSNRSFLPTHY